MATAKYFYDRLMGYDKESIKSGKYYYGYVNDCIDIHKKGIEDEYYTIIKNGHVVKCNFEKRKREDMKISDLTGDDFEIFNCVQIFKCGYLKLENSNSARDIQEAITNFHNYIASLEDPLNSEKNVPILCGGCCFYKGVTNKFHYYDTAGIQVDVSTISELCKENVNRKYYDLHCIPFIKSMENEKCIRIDFINCIYDLDQREDHIKMSKEALKHLLEMMDTIGISVKWVECKTNGKPIYC